MTEELTYKKETPEDTTIQKALYLLSEVIIPEVLSDVKDYISPQPSPLKALEKKQAIDNISKEAQEVLYLLLTTDKELEYQGKYSKQKIHTLLRKRKGWTLAFVFKIMTELETLNQEMFQI